jgi:hypothetical protein
MAHGAAAIHLPYPAGVAVSILQGYNGGTHQGVERFSLDLTRDDGKTSGSPALAPAPGTVVWADPPGSNHGCIGIQIDGGDGLHEMLCHIILDRGYGNGDHVGSAQALGTVAAPGLVGNNGVSHIHLQLYRVVGGSRTPVPFAAPDGAPLEGVSLSAGSSYNQWSCNGSGPGCHIVSQNGGSASPAAPRAGTITSDSGASSAGASLSAPRQQAGLGVGVPVVVSGTGDCLRLRAAPMTSGALVDCLPDGTQAVITDGPQVSDGYTWYKLGDRGWSVADYLVAQGPGSTLATPPAPAPMATSSGSNSVSAGSNGAAAAPPAPASTSASPPVVLPIGLSFTVGSSVVVTGTGDCVRVHSDATVSSSVVGCLPDGTTATVTDGPVQADGFTWWYLDQRGWVVADYLTAQ